MGWVRPNRPPRAFPAHRCYSLRIHPRRHHLYPRLIKNFRRMAAGMRHVLSRLSKSMAHKVFPFPIRRSLHAVRGHCPLKWPRTRKKGRVGVYERFLVSRRRRRSGFLDGSSRLVDGMGFVVEILV